MVLSWSADRLSKLWQATAWLVTMGLQPGQVPGFLLAGERLGLILRLQISGEP